MEILQCWLRQAEVCIERIDVSGTGLVTHSHGWSAEQQAGRVCRDLHSCQIELAIMHVSMHHDRILVFCWQMFLFQAFKDCCTTFFRKNCPISSTASLLLVREFWFVCGYVGVGACWCNIIPFSQKFDEYEIFVVLQAFLKLF